MYSVNITILCWLWKTTILVASIQQVIDREYPNLFYTSKDLKYVDVQHQMTNKYRSQERNMVPGFSTTSKTRPLIAKS